MNILKHKRPPVGVSVLIRHKGKVLLMQRASERYNGLWCSPGGHLEHGETFEQCGIREVEEEIGVKLTDARFLTAVNTIYPDDFHCVVVFLVADMPKGQKPRNLEPSKCAKLKWFPWDRQPKALMLGNRWLVDNGVDPWTVAV